MAAVDICRRQFKLDAVDWSEFWQWIEAEELFYTIPAPKK